MPPSNRKKNGLTNGEKAPHVKAAKAARLAVQAAADDVADAVPAVDDRLLAADAADGARRVPRQPAAERECMHWAHVLATSRSAQGHRSSHLRQF